ncbi:hypothetical protein [Paenibacillus koleovorans]|uniref:hypothetical protein n=1 Tax=Paenibacillus koleovorans TaxID=121608 RepID=UPI0013E2F6CE|nr:hypothetical protein [Paenibacillus koleovorans]
MVYLYSMLVFVIGGILFSFLVDQLLSKLKIHFITYFNQLIVLTALYVFGGLAVNTIFLLILSKGTLFQDLSHTSSLFYYGVVGALVFLYLDEILKKWLANSRTEAGLEIEEQ